MCLLFSESEETLMEASRVCKCRIGASVDSIPLCAAYHARTGFVLRRAPPGEPAGADHHADRPFQPVSVLQDRGPAGPRRGSDFQAGQTVTIVEIHGCDLYPDIALRRHGHDIAMTLVVNP